MGTNYYAVLDEPAACKCCGQPLPDGERVRLHIGKSSAGWTFQLRVDPAREINDWHDWLSILNDPQKVLGIIDEYGGTLTVAELRRVVEDRFGRVDFREKPDGEASWSDFLRRNHAVEGPNGLIRSAVDDWHCIGHGSGTWDLVRGEFC